MDISGRVSAESFKFSNARDAMPIIPHAELARNNGRDIASGNVRNQACVLNHSGLATASHVKGFEIGAFVKGNEEVRSYHISHMHIIAKLLAVFIHDRGLSIQQSQREYA